LRACCFSEPTHLLSRHTNALIVILNLIQDHRWLRDKAATGNSNSEQYGPKISQLQGFF